MRQATVIVRRQFSAPIVFATLCMVSLVCSGCSVQSANNVTSKSGSSSSGEGSKGSAAGELSGIIRIDGSSTVLPISRAVAEEFENKHNHKVQVPVGSTGTGGGFTKFAAGEIDINDASRPITEKEAEGCKKNAIEYLDLKIAIDGLTVAVNPRNDWCKSLTIEQLKKIWEPNSTVQKWSDVAPAWPAEKIQLYGADTASGTFDYFTEVVNGKAKASRTDYISNSDDNILVAGVSGDKYSLGYFGYAYFVENKDKLKAIGIASKDKPDAPVAPSDETIKSGAYSPMSRPLFLYINKKAISRPEVAAFLNFYLNEGQALVHEAKYIQLNPEQLSESQSKLKAAGG